MQHRSLQRRCWFPVNGHYAIPWGYEALRMIGVAAVGLQIPIESNSVWIERDEQQNPRKKNNHMPPHVNKIDKCPIQSNGLHRPIQLDDLQVQVRTSWMCPYRWLANGEDNQPSASTEFDISRRRTELYGRSDNACFDRFFAHYSPSHCAGKSIFKAQSGFEKVPAISPATRLCNRARWLGDRPFNKLFERFRAAAAAASAVLWFLRRVEKSWSMPEEVPISTARERTGGIADGCPPPSIRVKTGQRRSAAAWKMVSPFTRNENYALMAFFFRFAALLPEPQ